MAMKTAPEKVTLANLQVVVMPTGEVLCMGKSLGWVDKLGPYLKVKVK